MPSQDASPIADACNLIRRRNESFLGGRPFAGGAQELVAAVARVKTYLEAARSDGKPIRELDIAPNLLATPEGLRWVMPFVLSAESMEASKRRFQMG